MSGLAVIAGMVVGGGVGGFAGIAAAFAWADMDISSLDAVAYVLGGVVLGAAGGAYLAAEYVG